MIIMRDKKRAMGRGLGAILNAETKAVQTIEDSGAKDLVGSIMEIPIEDIYPNPNQPRTHFDEKALQELSESIKALGIIQPITLKKEGDKFLIISGERRYRASKLAGLKSIPAYIRLVNDQGLLEMALVENIQREDLNAVEEAMAYQSLMTEYHLSQEELAERVAKKRSTIANSLRLLKLEEEILEYLRQNLLSEGHARALLSVENKEKRISLAKECVERKWSVREMERRAKEEKTPTERQEKPKNLSSQWKTIVHGLEEKMKEHLGTKVKITAKNEDKGKVEIEYYSKEDLDRITRILEGRGEE